MSDPRTDPAGTVRADHRGEYLKLYDPAVGEPRPWLRLDGDPDALLWVSNAAVADLPVLGAVDPGSVALALAGAEALARETAATAFLCADCAPFEEISR